METRFVCQWLRGGGMRSDWLMGTRFLSGVMKIFCNYITVMVAQPCGYTIDKNY